MPRKILIVDDMFVNRQTLKIALRGAYEILEAANGEDALEIMLRNDKAICAVLLDIVMPGIDGYEVLRQIRHNPALAQIPVVMITGFEDEAARVKCLALGANDFVMKPYNPEVLRHCLKNCISLWENASIADALRRDRLTGLYTREAFFDRVESALKEHGPGYYVMSCFDIDNFKVINDQYGSARGDYILQCVGKIVREDMERLGGAYGRISADNFAALFPAREVIPGSSFVDRMRDKAACFADLNATLAFSEGRCIANDLALSAAALYDRAYLAKRSIKGRYDKHLAYFDETMRDALILEQQIIAEMDAALADRQFEAWFQPQYNHSTGALIGAEALARWRHPQKGLIPPGDFIPVFEQNGFVYELDKYIWEEVCRCLRRWIDEGRDPLPVSVNISRYDVFRPDLVDVITGLVQKYGLPAALLRLEITESAFSQSSEQIIAVVKRLMAFGFTMEIDDFGSGYSSLNTLKDVPAQVLKLDMRFLENSENSQRGGNILESVVRMAKWLNMSVIAEGVETIEQADFLKSIGSSYVQGYLYARPMPAGEYEALCGNAGKEQRLLALETVKNLDNNFFWDPKSMETLIFNSYVGGACIFEYHNGREELLRVNDKYAQTFGEGVSSEDIYGRGVWEYMDEANRAIRADCIRRAIDTANEAACETVAVGLYGIASSVYIRSTMRVIARSGDHYLLYCTIINTTAQREAERKRLEAAERLSAIMQDAGSGITAAVLDGEKVNFLFSNEKYYEILGYTRRQYDEEVADPYALIHPEDRDRVRGAAMRAYLTQKSTQIEYRVILRDKALRWVRVGLSSTRFTGIDRDVQLSIMTDISAEKADEQKLRDTSALLVTLMNDTPGGFVRMRVYPDGRVTPIYFNEEFYRLTGMTRDELMALYGDDAMAGVHPDDVCVARAALAQMVENGEAHSTRYRLRRGKDGYVWLTVFGRITKDAAGNTFLNIYYTDATREAKAEQQQKELLDNLPCGAALYAYDGRRLSVVHLNKRYWELVNRAPAEYSQASFLSAVHPDDRETIFRELARAIAQQRDVVCDIRILYENDNYRQFHVVGRIVPKEDGRYAIYASYTAVSDDAIALTEMLPVVLSTIMESTSDLSFVKDKRFKYLCASRAFAKMTGAEDERAVVGKTDYDLFPEEIARKYRADDEKLLESGKSLIDMVEAIPSGDGVPRYSSTSKYILRDARANVIGLYGTGRDITRYRDAFDKLKLLIDNVQGGLATYACTRDKVRLTYYNDTFCKLLGYARDELAVLVQKDALGMVCQEDLPLILEQISALTRDGTPIYCTFRVNTKRDGRKWINLRGSLSERLGDVVIVNAVMFDVTENRRQLGSITAAMAEEQKKYQHLLQKTYDLTIENMPDYVAKWLFSDGDVLLVYANQKYLDFMGITAENAYGKSIIYGFTPEEKRQVIDLLYDKEKTRSNIHFTSRACKASGGECYLAVNASFFEERDGKSVYYGTLTDVTDLIGAQQRLRISEKEYRVAAALSDYAVMRYDVRADSIAVLSQGKIDLVFPQYTENAVEKAIEDGFVAPESADKVRSIFDAIHRGVPDGRETVVLTKPGGEKRWVELVFSITNDDDGKPATAIITVDDKTEIRRAELDGMTGLYNKSAAQAIIKARLARLANAPCALLIADLDNLKTINDTLGHDQGDRAIQAFGEALKAQFRQTDVIGRIGGDEFIAFLGPCGSPEWLTGVIGAFLKRVSARRIGAEDQFALRGSIGIAYAKTGANPYETLFKQADKALYHVKRNGKNDFAFYTPDMEQSFYAYKNHVAEQGEAGVLSLTMREASAMMEELHLVFDIVRLVDARRMAPYSPSASGGLTPGEHQCFAVWNRDQRCENCVSYRALIEKTRLTKRERIGDQLYQVIAKYVEIDGNAYVLETVVNVTGEQ